MSITILWMNEQITPMAANFLPILPKISCNMECSHVTIPFGWDMKLRFLSVCIIRSLL
jgi:hypothetical protein